jgi:2-succinyl-5-enolpyruvyl-6-hydroxy-3-cyclohexene-1-carboxylate synthase
MTATDTYLLLRAFCDELARCGMRDACTSPGSRCTPIVLSLARERRIRSWSHLDERCAAFFALGAAKATGLPVAIACTSGTAAANYAPAVIEAHHARVPLIVLTADRPPELRDNGAGQAIDQLKLYGDAAKWFCEVGVDVATPETLRWMRTLACRAYWTALGGSPGPVHLNFPLREPLVLDGQLPPDPLPGRPDGGPWVASSRHSDWTREPLGKGLAIPLRTVIVAGRDERTHPHWGGAPLAAAVGAFAERWAVPVLADPLSGTRGGPNAIGAYDLLLRDPGFAEAMAPELVIRVGDLPTSKPLRAWLAGLPPGVWQLALDPDGTWQDPAGVVSERDTGDPVRALAILGRDEQPDQEWLASWLEADAAAAAALTSALADEQSAALTEPGVARLLGEHLAPGATLFVAASMPIRDLELYLPARRPLPRVLSNRGANGIDGTVSSAFGVAATSADEVVLLIGDVALAHDIGGLAAAARHGLQITIVLINNDGGGIFHFLPVAGEADAFEEHVATPHGLQFEHAAGLYGIEYQRAGTEPELTAALARATAGGVTTIIEVRTDRVENLALHRRLAQAGLAALAQQDTDAAATP